MKVQLLDLKAQYEGIREEIKAALDRVLDSQSFILGAEVEEFERKMASYFNVPEAIGLASGSDALLLALKALGIGPGDGVVTTPFTFFATGGAIARAGARPIFVDIDPLTCNLDPKSLEEFIRKGQKSLPVKCKAVIPVHIFGHPAEMGRIIELARTQGWKVIEDACQAIGAEYLGKKVGTWGELGCFSFFPSKNLGGFGDGGMAVTRDLDWAAKIRRLRVHGSDRKYHHLESGINSRLDALQAAVLGVKLAYLDQWNEARREKARRYEQMLGDIEEVSLPPEPGREVIPVYHLYAIRAQRRDELENFLRGRGIGTGVYYPTPLHLQPCFRELGGREGDFPEAERAAREVLVLPMYPELGEEQQEYVIGAVRDFYRN